MKIQHNLTDYLGCEFHMNKERTRGWLGQPSIIKSLEQKFGDRAMKERLSLTPGTPRFTARRLENPEDKVNIEEHDIYRSGVGTLLYLTKHSRPDICNPVRGDRIPSTTPGAEPPGGTKDSGSARSHSTHLETSSQKRP